MNLSKDERFLCAWALDLMSERFDRHAHDAAHSLAHPTPGVAPTNANEPAYWRNYSQEALELARRLRGHR